MQSGIHTTGLQKLPHPASLSKQQVSSSTHLFNEVLQNEIEEQQLKISKHAEKRLFSREVNITVGEWDRITEKVKEAKTKGVTDSIVITDHAALVVSPKNNTVITAMSKQEAAEHIFTNINGTIVI